MPSPSTPFINVEKARDEVKVNITQKDQRRKQHPVVPDQCWAVSVGRQGKTSHRVRRASWNLKLSEWDTWCGWHFAEKNVKVSLTPKFLATTKKCKKCEKAHQSRDFVKGEISLAQLVNLNDGN